MARLINESTPLLDRSSATSATTLPERCTAPITAVLRVPPPRGLGLSSLRLLRFLGRPADVGLVSFDEAS